MSLIRPCFLVGAVVIGSTGAFAQSQDVLTWRASVNETDNNNFFNSASAQVSDRLTAETVGVNLSLPYSLQRFELDASVVSNQYQTNSSFNYTGTNYNASWMWSVTPQFHGTLNSTRAETLNAATDSVDPTLRNKSTVNSTALSAAYDVDGPWQLTAGVVNSSTVNERQVIGQGDNHSTGANAGVRYALASGNSLAYFHQVANGDSGFSYVLTTDDVAVIWVLTGNTTLNAHIANLAQRFDGGSQFDFNGTSGGANVVWRTSGKTSITAGWLRELASYQTSTASYTQTDSLSLAPTWDISPITSLSFQYRAGVLTDQGNPYGSTSERKDNLQDTSLAFSWKPHKLVSLTATVSESSRSSNIANTDFRTRLISVLAAISF